MARPRGPDAARSSEIRPTSATVLRSPGRRTSRPPASPLLLERPLERARPTVAMGADSRHRTVRRAHGPRRRPTARCHGLGRVLVRTSGARVRERTTSVATAPSSSTLRTSPGAVRTGGEHTPCERRVRSATRLTASGPPSVALASRSRRAVWSSTVLGRHVRGLRGARRAGDDRDVAVLRAGALPGAPRPDASRWCDREANGPWGDSDGGGFGRRTWSRRPADACDRELAGIVLKSFVHRQTAKASIWSVSVVPVGVTCRLRGLRRVRSCSSRQ